MNKLIEGASLLQDASRLMFKPGIRGFVIVPLFINILLFGGAIWFGLQVFDSLMASMSSMIPGWLQWIKWLLWPIFIVTILMLIYFSFTLVANIIAAPFNSILAERVETVVLGSNYETTPAQSVSIQLVARTLWSELRKLLYQMKWLIALIIFSFIPLINLAAPAAWIYYGAWVFAIEYVDYPMGNHGLRFNAVKQHLKSRRQMALGLGFGITLLTLIPILNFFAMPLSVIAATLFWIRREDASQMINQV